MSCIEVVILLKSVDKIVIDYISHAVASGSTIKSIYYTYLYIIYKIYIVICSVIY